MKTINIIFREAFSFFVLLPIFLISCCIFALLNLFRLKRLTDYTADFLEILAEFNDDTVLSHRVKTFKHLDFEPHPLAEKFELVDAVRAVKFFKNNYGVSVISGNTFSVYKDKPYSVEVIRRTINGDFEIVSSSTTLTDDKPAYFSKEGVTQVMIEVQKLKKINLFWPRFIDSVKGWLHA